MQTLCAYNARLPGLGRPVNSFTGCDRRKAPAAPTRHSAGWQAVTVQGQPRSEQLIAEITHQLEEADRAAQKLALRRAALAKQLQELTAPSPFQPLAHPSQTRQANSPLEPLVKQPQVLDVSNSQGSLPPPPHHRFELPSLSPPLGEQSERLGAPSSYSEPSPPVRQQPRSHTHKPDVVDAAHNASNGSADVSGTTAPTPRRTKRLRRSVKFQALGASLGMQPPPASSAVMRQPPAKSSLGVSAAQATTPSAKEQHLGPTNGVGQDDSLGPQATRLAPQDQQDARLAPGDQQDVKLFNGVAASTQQAWGWTGGDSHVPQHFPDILAHPPAGTLATACKPIYVLSDGTGESAARTVRAALRQFELSTQQSCPTAVMVFPFVMGLDKLHEICDRAQQESALLVHTLVDPAGEEELERQCEGRGLTAVDLWSPLLRALENHLHATRSGVPRLKRRSSALSADYSRLIAAVEFTRRMDDGAMPQRWQEADVLVLGVSRCGKTPLCIYLGQKGFKVANLPLVPGLPLPPQLWEVDQRRVVCLTIDAVRLAAIRRHRLGDMGLEGDAKQSRDGGGSIDYAHIKVVQEELDWAHAFYAENPTWPVLDVTLRGVEETAALVLCIMAERFNDVLPLW